MALDSESSADESSASAPGVLALLVCHHNAPSLRIRVRRGVSGPVT